MERLESCGCIWELYWCKIKLRLNRSCRVQVFAFHNSLGDLGVCCHSHCNLLYLEAIVHFSALMRHWAMEAGFGGFARSMKTRQYGKGFFPFPFSCWAVEENIMCCFWGEKMYLNSKHMWCYNVKWDLALCSACSLENTQQWVVSTPWVNLSPGSLPLYVGEDLSWVKW